ncbi:DUF938 domain-containing protein [Aurantiacibacter suaedae]|uniref:DUF938 domain-containing protein n=1 Tax=Aurantiacibacter suaedae TaxID=2545755 RepID=UPI0010F8AFBF|nr:DUF938 domain-containing protein [Aurantiacibacter suaedae]
MKRHAPATERNRAPIAEVLARELPASGLVLEVASGTGEHGVHFAGLFANITWQPSDPDPEALASIAAWGEDYAGENLLPPIQLDASAEDWPVARADAIYCSNMAHISPMSATEGLVVAAGKLLSEGAPLILYGPWLENEVETSPSNLTFGESLKARNPQWGLREREWLDDLCRAQGLTLTARHKMPANNLVLVYRRKG